MHLHTLVLADRCSRWLHKYNCLTGCGDIRVAWKVACFRRNILLLRLLLLSQLLRRWLQDIGNRNILFQGRPLVGTHCISLSFYQLLIHSTSKERRGTSDLAALVAVNAHEASLVTEALHYGRKYIAPQDLLGESGGGLESLRGRR